MSTPPRPIKVVEPLGAQNQRKRNRMPTNENLLTTRTLLTTGANGIMRNAQGRPFLPRAPIPPPASTFQGWNTRKGKKGRKSKKTRRTRKN